MFQINVTVAQSKPKTTDPPRLQVIGSIADPMVSIQCYVDLEPFFVTQDPEKAAILLLASYYVVNVNFAGPAKQSLITLSCALLTPQNVDVIFQSNSKLVAVLKKLDIKL